MKKPNPPPKAKYKPVSKPVPKPLPKPIKQPEIKTNPVKDLKSILLDSYSTIADKIEKSVYLKSDSTDSGFWPDSLVQSLVLGKISPSMYVFSGPEQSAKSSAAISLIGAGLKSGIPLVKHVDSENAMSPGYMPSLMEHASNIPWSELYHGKNPRYRYTSESNLDDIFYDFSTFLHSLPSKIYDAERKEWFLVFENKSSHQRHKDMLAQIEGSLQKDKKLSDSNWTYFAIGQDPSMQALLVIDSLKALTLTQVEEGSRTKQPAQLAKAFAENLPYVKGLLKRKNVGFICINQMMENPLAMQNRKPTEYETGGNSIKFNSDVRVITKSISVPDVFDRAKEDYKLSVEPSVINPDRLDYYSYKSIRNIKNKVSKPFLASDFRIWVRGVENTPGIDPVYDAAQFFK